MKGMVEKPAQGTAPSNLSISGRYILQPEIFDLLAHAGKGRGQRDPADRRHGPTDGGPVDFTAVEYEGVTHDCGDKIGLLKANVALALKRPDLGEAPRGGDEIRRVSRGGRGSRATG
jgi:UTP--glucose-1-phosphate uridylyltransferase